MRTERQRRQWDGRQGFTLTEVMVSMLLMAVAAAAVFGLSHALQNMNRLSDHVSDATSLTESKIEDLRGERYASLASSNDTVGAYSRTWTVITNAANLHKNVVVETEWTDRRGQSSTRIMAVFVERQ